MTYDDHDETALTELIDSTIMELAIQEQREPYYILSGSGPDWFLDPDGRQMIQIQRGTEIVPIGGPPDSKDRVLVRVPYRFILVPQDQISEVGWN